MALNALINTPMPEAPLEEEVGGSLISGIPRLPPLHPGLKAFERLDRHHKLCAPVTRQDHNRVVTGTQHLWGHRLVRDLSLVKEQEVTKQIPLPTQPRWGLVIVSGLGCKVGAVTGAVLPRVSTVEVTLVRRLMAHRAVIRIEVGHLSPTSQPQSLGQRAEIRMRMMLATPAASAAVVLQTLTAIQTIDNGPEAQGEGATGR